MKTVSGTDADTSPTNPTDQEPVEEEKSAEELYWESLDAGQQSVFTDVMRMTPKQAYVQKLASDRVTARLAVVETALAETELASAAAVETIIAALIAAGKTHDCKVVCIIHNTGASFAEDITRRRRKTSGRATPAGGKRDPRVIVGGVTYANNKAACQALNLEPFVGIDKRQTDGVFDDWRSAIDAHAANNALDLVRPGKLKA